MKSGISWMDRTLYPSFRDGWDDWLLREAILDVLRTSDVVLDLGAGAGIVEAVDLRGRAARVCGVDPDERVLGNPYLDDAKVGTGDAIPYPDAYFDLAFCDNVLEHLEDPERVFREVARVLKPGGRFLVKTPNLRHYVAQIARLTPHWFHQFYNRVRGRASIDTFPTLYRVNTPEAVGRVAASAGLEVESVRLIEGRPEYLRTTVPTYVVGWVYERLVNTVPALEGYRVVLVALMRKPWGS